VTVGVVANPRRVARSLLQALQLDKRCGLLEPLKFQWRWRRKSALSDCFVSGQDDFRSLRSSTQATALRIAKHRYGDDILFTPLRAAMAHFAWFCQA